MSVIKLYEEFNSSQWDGKSTETVIGDLDNFTLVYQTSSKMMGGNGVNGTIRTAPENYYVATIAVDGDIVFDDLESMTRSINKEEVTNLYYSNKDGEGEV